jgi:predicted enzyme related to lactoylglutathione lyase
MLVFRFERGTAIVGRIIHVELTAADVDRAADFYAKAFGWQSTASPFVDGYLVAETGTGDGIDGAIMRREYRDQPAIAWIEVDDLDRSLEAVREAGGTTEGDPQEIPGIGRLAYITDTEGTLVGLRQPA